MLELEDALKRILYVVQPLGDETIELISSRDRTVAQSIAAPVDLPSFDNSAMDGYAVCSSDLVSASQERPVCLRQIGRIAAGQVFTGQVERGSCVRLFTGSPLPKGADAVVMQEDTR